MKVTNDWLKEFEKSLLLDCYPMVFGMTLIMIIIGITGLLWSLPLPEEFRHISPLLNWGSAFLMVTAIYYFIISISLAIGLVPFLLILSALHVAIVNTNLPMFKISISLIIWGTFILAIYRKGSISAIAKDFQLIMIGPAWLLSILYKRYEISI